MFVKNVCKILMGSNNNNSITTTIIVFDYRINELFIFFTIPLYGGDSNICVRGFFFVIRVAGLPFCFFFFLAVSDRREHTHTQDNRRAACVRRLFVFFFFFLIQPVRFSYALYCVAYAYRTATSLHVSDLSKYFSTIRPGVCDRRREEN